MLASFFPFPHCIAPRCVLRSDLLKQARRPPDSHCFAAVHSRRWKTRGGRRGDVERVEMCWVIVQCWCRGNRLKSEVFRRGGTEIALQAVS